MRSKFHFPLFLALTFLLASFLAPFSFRQVTAQAFGVQHKTYYGKYYGVNIGVSFLEHLKSKYPDFNPIDFIWYYLEEFRTRYGIEFRYLKFAFDFFNDSSISEICSLMQTYVGHFATYYNYKILVQLGALRQTSQKFNDTFLNWLYGNISQVLNPYADKIVAFLGENELEGNTTCPICGKKYGYPAFNGNVSDMIAYAKKLHDTWHKYSSIPFSHSSVAPWRANETHVFSGFWFDGMEKSTYKTYIDESQDILCWNCWYYTDGTQYIHSLADELDKKVIISEHFNFNTSVLKQIIDGFGDRLIAICFFTLAAYDKQTLFDWACPEHFDEGYAKHSLFAMVKIPVEDIPEGSYFGIAAIWHDLNYTYNWAETYLYAYGSCFANRTLNLESEGNETISVWVDFQAVATCNAYYPHNYIGFARFVTEDGYYSLGALIYHNATFRYCFEWISNDGATCWYLHDLSNLTWFNKWHHLKLVHDGQQIKCILDGNTVFTANNGKPEGSRFTEVRFGDWVAEVSSIIYVDDIQLWFGDELVFRETFENPMDDWVKWIYPLHAPIYIDRGKFGWIDYICVYEAQNLLYGYYSLHSFQFSENRVWKYTDDYTQNTISLTYSFDLIIPEGAIIRDPTFKLAFAFPSDVCYNIELSVWKVTIEIKDQSGILGIFSTKLEVNGGMNIVEMYIEGFVLTCAEYRVNLNIQLQYLIVVIGGPPRDSAVGIGYVKSNENWIKMPFGGLISHFGLSYAIKQIIPGEPAKNHVSFTFRDENGNPIDKYVCGYIFNETKEEYEPLQCWEKIDVSTYVTYLANGSYELEFSASGYKEIYPHITINGPSHFSYTMQQYTFYNPTETVGGRAPNVYIMLRSKVLSFAGYVNGNLDIDQYGFVHCVSDSGKIGYVKVEMHYRTGFPSFVIEAENISILQINVPRVYWTYTGENYDDLIEESRLIGIAINSNDTVTVKLYTLYKPSKVYKGENEFENWRFKNGVLTFNLESGDPTFSIIFSPITYYAEKTEQVAFEWLEALLVLALVLAGIGIMRRLAG